MARKKDDARGTIVIAPPAHKATRKASEQGKSKEANDGKGPEKKAKGPVKRQPFKYQGTAKLTSSLVKEMGEQPRTIAAAILSSKQALSNDQLATLVKGKITSVQPLTRVTSFYLTKWKKEGLVARV